MNFDKFKSIDMPDVNVASDTEYLDKLNALPPSAPKKRIWATVGTVAAAVAIVAVVALWAIIGRGVRGTNTPVIPANESVEITDEMQAQFEEMYGKYSLHSFPSFERGTLPSKEAIIEFIDYEPESYKAESGDFGDMYNAFVLDWFGVTPDYRVDTNARQGRVITTDYFPPKLLSFTRSQLDDGTKIVTLTYGDIDSWVVTISYVPTTDFEPDYFIENTTLNTIFLHKIDKENMTAAVYKVSGELATQILDAKRYLKHSDSTCKCIPDYRVYDSSLWYDFMLDGVMPHTTRYDAPSCQLTKDEQSRFKELFEKCVTDENYVETKEFEYTPTESEVTVTVPEIATGYKAGSYTITGDNAKALITALETKSYTGPIGLQASKMIELTVDKHTYCLYIDKDKVYIENDCGSVTLEPDDEIKTVVEKYIISPKKVTLINAPEVTIEALADRTVEDRANENPTSKTFEFDGKTIELTFEEKKAANAAGGYLYKYTDSDGIVYEFYENKHLVWRTDNKSPSQKGDAITVTEDVALETAKKYAELMLTDEYEDYTLTKAYTHNYGGDRIEYRYTFEKLYGKDGFLSGEACRIYIHKDGRVKDCSTIERYVFENFDPSLVAGISKQDVDTEFKKIYNTEPEDYYLQEYEGKWYIGVNYTSGGWLDTCYFEIA